MLEKLKKVNKQQLLLFIVATFMWISVKSGQFMMKTNSMSLTENMKLVANIVAISGLVGVIARLPLGVFQDYIKNKVLIIRITLFISFVMGIIFLTNPNANSLYIYNLSMGVAICTWVMFNVLYAGHSENKTVGIALLSIANNIGSYVAPMVAGNLIKKVVIDDVTKFDFTGQPSVIFAVIMMGLALGFSLLLKNVDKKEIQKIEIKKVIKNIFNYKLLLVATITMILTFMKYSTIRYSFETIVKSLGGSPGNIGNIDANYDLLHAIAGLIAGGILIKYIGYRKTVAFGILVMTASIYFAATIHNLTAFLIFNLLAGFGMGMAFVVLMSMSINNNNLEYKNTNMGAFQSIYMLGVFFGPQISNLIESTTNSTTKYDVYMVNSVIGLVTLLIVLFTFGIFDKKEKVS